MRPIRRGIGGGVAGVLCMALCASVAPAAPAGRAPASVAPPPAAAAPAPIVFPLDRTAYFIGERVPVALTGEGDVKLEAVGPDGRVPLYQGKPGAILLDTTWLAPGEYALEVNGAATGATIALTPVVRKSAGSLQDEVLPNERPQMTPQEQKDPAVREQKVREHREGIVRTLRETGVTACFNLGASDMGRRPVLDVLARTATLVMVNSDTRPTSFCPPSLNPLEIDGMSQRMLLTAQANGRYPNFGGFCFGWDVCGFAPGGRKMLLAYWGWGDQVQPLRNYIDRNDRIIAEAFARRTGLRPISTEEYITYLLSIGRPELAPAIDLPTRRWLDELAAAMKPLPEREQADLQKRLDAWSAFLMGLYAESYANYLKNFRPVDPTLRATSSIQVDHCPTLHGQYFPWAYRPLDFQYQSTWNDQVGGPDYAYQWLLTAALLEMGRGDRPTWISNALEAAHGRSRVPGKFVRTIAHNLAYGASGAGFALEGFSNVLGGMNRGTSWENLRGTPGGEGLLAGRDFLDRFAALAVEARGDHGVGILFSRSQLARQFLHQGFGTPQYRCLVALVRLGYTPRFVTEEELQAQGLKDVKALVVPAQAVPLPQKVQAALAAFTAAGGRVLADRATSVDLPRAERLDLALPFTSLGKPFNWGVPNMAAGQNDAILYARWHPELAAAFSKALGETGHALFISEKGPETLISLLQLAGGRDARYVVAVNDSHIKTQADWHQVKERLRPTGAADAGAWVYDCTEEKPLGRMGPLVADLSATTARVYAVLAREPKRIALGATQSVKTGGEMVVAVEFHDDAGRRLEAVLPFHVAVIRPDGKVSREFYRSTAADGTFSMALPVPANVPAGTWSLAVRSQLTGEVAALPVKLEAAPMPAVAAALTEPVVVREKAAIEAMLARGAKVALLLFDNEHLAALLPAAEKVKAVLAARGVAVEILQKPAVTTYLLAYDPSAEVKAENARADRGETVGKIKRTTLNGNDWYSALGGYRFGRPVILLDVAGRADNEMAEALDKAGLLWPAVTPAFPGRGRAVVQAVAWAFAPRTPALVIQAADAEGLMAGAEALAGLPEDHLTGPVRAVREELFRQYHVGGTPSRAGAAKLTADGLKVTAAPRPFRINFLDAPPPADQLPPPTPVERPVTVVPGLALPAEFTPHMFHEGKYVEASSPGGGYKSDLRFTDATLIALEVGKAGRTPVVAEGMFRYSDARPRSQPQWEEILALCDKYLRRERRPMEMDVFLDGKPVGRLVPTRAESREVPVETLPGYAKEKPRSVTEEVVVGLGGTVDLPAGRHELLLVHRNMVDGRLERVRLGVSADEAAAIEKARAEEADRRKAEKERQKKEAAARAAGKKA